MSGFDLMAVLSNADFRALLLHGLRMTFVIAICSWFLAMALGIALLGLRLTPSRFAEGFVKVYVSYHRNVPTLVQLILWYFGIFSLFPPDFQFWLVGQVNTEALFAIVALGLCQGAYFSEDLRSGLRSVPPGQREAARALGHSYVSSMRYVLMPQATRNALPALINHSVSLFKNSSLAMAIGVSELTHASREIGNLSFRVFEAYLVATIAYLAISLVIMAAGVLVDKRLSAGGAR